MTGLAARAVVARRGLDLELTVPPGEVLAVLGPNGAGKSTTLHVIAGLVEPDAGCVRIGDRVVTDTDTGVQVPTHARRVGLMLQNPLLFPHLSVGANVAFGPRSRHRMGRAAARACALRWLTEVDAGDLADRTPRQLSGGQAQRVALARALAAEPDALLLDEPMAGLDVAVAGAMRKVLRRVLTVNGRCAVLITHDLLDVLTLADRVVVIEAGHIVESGSAAAVLAVPKSRFAAHFAGVNLVAGIAAGAGDLTTAWGASWHGTPTGDVVPGGPAVAVFAPSAVAVYRDEPHGSPRNTVAVTVAELDSRGPGIRVRADEQPDGAPGLAADITAESAAELRLTPGERVYFTVKAQEIAVHPAS
ncbi:sulfate/molybdate ABC transporter ATP-binding protein [Mycobacterium sp. 141]|uniref:sulfate/molybdate ABC transporter ATP-binding protein n=1 Tax=Mycobacterium sp. 141 TaxID=1120797 RepID=UPI0004768043|nr:ATP-binding cassette domain-containing protein [Mycobacterium sp. 141]